MPKMISSRNRWSRFPSVKSQFAGYHWVQVHKLNDESKLVFGMYVPAEMTDDDLDAEIWRQLNLRG